MIQPESGHKIDTNPVCVFGPSTDDSAIDLASCQVRLNRSKDSSTYIGLLLHEVGNYNMIDSI
jgi:hypothetical protein